MTLTFQSGTYRNIKDFKAFIPSFINRDYTVSDGRILALLELAGRYIGELNAYSKNLPNIQSFLYMLALEEATISNKIEGTRITVNEVLSPDEEILPEMRNEKTEVINYLNSLDYSYSRLTGVSNILTEPVKDNVETIPFCTRLIKEAHKILLTNSRGEQKLPGEFRTSQNWIGGTMPSTASFVPPPYEELPELLSDFEKFWHNDSIYLPVLIKIAISHYQFETIHPFLDGNGRIGRLIILLQLVDSGLLELPTLYLSRFFEQNRKKYYDALDLVRRENNMNQWIVYFLEGVCDTAKYTVQKLKQIDDLNNECEERIKKNPRSHVNASKLLKLLYLKSRITVAMVCENLGLDYQNANNLLKSFVKLGILTEAQSRRIKVYTFSEYLAIFN